MEVGGVFSFAVDGGGVCRRAGIIVNVNEMFMKNYHELH